jgi:ELWxxDGT repeat protein
MRKAWIAVLAMAVVCAAHPGQAQEPVLVQDIATGPAYSWGSSASPPVQFQGAAYFSADDGFLGSELWATNGTLRGTRLVADLCPGRCPGGPRGLTPSGGLLFFVAGNTTDGAESFWLWRSNGTTGGTFPLVDLGINSLGSAGPLSFLAPFQDGVVFIVHDRARRAWSLWGSDGTRTGTHQIATLPGGFNPDQAPSDVPDWPRAQNDPRKHYFAWRKKLWVTDGTASGTRPVATPVRPCGGGWARIGRLVVYEGRGPARDCEPWVSDGTVQGTRLLRDIWPGRYPSFSGSFVAAGGMVYFTASNDHGQRQLWKTNGTSRGTVIVRVPGASRGFGDAGILGVAGSRVYFTADDGKHGTELWRTDGSPASTVLVADLSPGTADSFVSLGGSLGDQLFFVATTSETSTSGLFRTQGSADTTVRLIDVDDESGLSAVGGRMYIAGRFPEEGLELAVTDGTVEGTHVLDLARPVASSDPRQLIAGAGGLIFVAAGVESGFDLWRSGGHPWDTEPLADLVQGFGPSDYVRLMPGSGGAFYVTYDEERFGWTDGQTAGDLLPPQALPSPQSFIDLGDRTIFFGTRPVSATDWQPWVWASDGTPDGTAPVTVAAGGTGTAASFQVRAALVPETGEVRYLVQQADAVPAPALSKLTATDGTAAGTRELVTIPSERSQTLDLFVAAGRTMFASFWNSTRSSLWASDGTEEGTREVYAIDHPWDFAFINGLTAVASLSGSESGSDQAFFVAGDVERGRELWVSDGTPEGTHRVADLAPGAASSDPTDLAAFGDRILFSADDGAHGRELWVSDGTAEGTHLLEIHPGPKGSYPQAFLVVGDRVVFAADDGLYGLEVWETDGTPDGTHMVADVLVGPRSSSPRSFTVYGDELYFNAGRLQEGYELWKLPLADL